MAAKMFLMCGHPGSGKSYFAKRFAEINGYRYLAIDDTYAYFNGSPYSHDNKFDVWMTFFRQIHAAEMAGVDIVVDTNAPTRIDRAEFTSWFPTFEHHLIWIDASMKQCLENNQKRGRVIPHDQMLKIFSFFEVPDAEEYYSFNPRANWKSFSLVNNVDNHFLFRKTLYGEFPSDIKEYRE